MYERIPDEVCASYAAGHQMHWIHWKRTLDAERIPFEVLRIDDEKVEIRLATTRRLVTYWHHDLVRLRDIIDLRLPTVAFPGLHALKVGGYFFNCADRPLTSQCRSVPHSRI